VKANSDRRFRAVHLRHVEIHKYQVEAFLLGDGQGLLSAAGDSDLVRMPLE